MIRIETPEDARQFHQLTDENREHGAAITRYAAAMYFYNRGMISGETLEVYRICSPLDGENAKAVLAERGLAADVP